MSEKGNETLPSKDPTSPDSNPAAPAGQQQQYSVFSPLRKLYLTYLLGYLTLAFSLTATIYFPLISLLSTQYAVSI